jgi:hypothetical protein
MYDVGRESITNHEIRRVAYLHKPMTRVLLRSDFETWGASVKVETVQALEAGTVDT